MHNKLSLIPNAIRFSVCLILLGLACSFSPQPSIDTFPFTPTTSLESFPTNAVQVSPTEMLSDTPIPETQTPTDLPAPTDETFNPSTAPPSEQFDLSKLGTVERNLTYCVVDEFALRMDVYYPETAERAWPVVVIIHGGGWTTGDKTAGPALSYAEPLVNANYLVVAVNYRLSPEVVFPAHIEDVKCAIRSLRANAYEFNLDPTKIGVIGFSSGGHLAALLGTTDASAGFDTSGGYLEYSSRVQAVVDIAGVNNPRILCANVTAQEIFGAENCLDDERMNAANAGTYVSSDDPPFLIIHGDRDNSVALVFSQYLKDELDASGVLAILYIVQNAGHSFQPLDAPMNPSIDEIYAFVVQFFSAIIP